MRRFAAGLRRFSSSLVGLVTAFSVSACASTKSPDDTAVVPRSGDYLSSCLSFEVHEFEQAFQVRGLRGRVSVGEDEGTRFGGVQIAARELATDDLRWVRTDDRGEFDFGPLPRGEYEVWTCFDGFDEVRFRVELRRSATAEGLKILICPSESGCGSTSILATRDAGRKTATPYVSAVPGPERLDAWPDEAPRWMGLPTAIAKGREIRIWTGGGIVRPFFLYRIVVRGERVRGERIAWVDNIAPRDGTSRDVRYERDVLSFLRDQFCRGTLHQAGEVAWCAAPTEPAVDWARIVDRLHVDRLWPLTDQSRLGFAGCVSADGEGVTIELLEPDRRHRVHYGSPESCCPWPECAVVADVLEVVREIP